MTAPTTRVRVVDTTLYGAQHEAGTIVGRSGDEVCVRFMCRCQVATAAGYSEAYRAAHDLWFPTWEVEPA